MEQLIIPAPTKEEMIKSLSRSPEEYMPDFDILKDGSIRVYYPNEKIIEKELKKG